MDKNKVPTIKLYRTKEYTFKQSKYDVAPTIPFSMIITGQSGFWQDCRLVQSSSGHLPRLL